MRKSVELVAVLGLATVLAGCGSPSSQQIEAVNKMRDPMQPFSPATPSLVLSEMENGNCQNVSQVKMEGVAKLIQTIYPQQGVLTAIAERFQLTTVEEVFTLKDSMYGENSHPLVFSQNRNMGSLNNASSNDISAILKDGSAKFLTIKAVITPTDAGCQLVTNQTAEVAQDPHNPDPNSQYWRLVSKNECDPGNKGTSGQHFQLDNDLKQPVSDAWVNDEKNSKC